MAFRKSLVASLVLFLSLLIASCEIFTQTAFSGFLNFVIRIESLEGVAKNIDDLTSTTHRMAIINDFIFLVLDNQQLIILDRSLNVQREHSGVFESLGVYSANDGVYHFGTLDLDDSFEVLAPDDYPEDGFGFDEPLSANIFVLLTQTPAVLDTWNAPGLQMPPATISGELTLVDIAFEPIDDSVILFFTRNGNSAEGIRLIVEDIDGTTAPPGLQGLQSYPFGKPIVELPVADGWRHHYTRGGLAIRQEDSLIRVTSSGDKKEELKWEGHGESVEAFDIRGDTFYIYDSQEKRIYQCRTWWN